LKCQKVRESKERSPQLEGKIWAHAWQTASHRHSVYGEGHASAKSFVSYEYGARVFANIKQKADFSGKSGPRSDKVLIFWFFDYLDFKNRTYCRK
jgi:hypothetical protein